ncbi:MAG: AbrB family transcriptional regulator [Tagaea sp.]
MGGVDLRALAITVAIGTLGGALFKWLTVPLPWMLGALCFTTAAAMRGAAIVMPRDLRNGFVTILGVMLGAGFTPAVLARIDQWAITLAGLVVWAVVAGALAYVYFRRVPGYDRTTAFFAATPGGLAEMTLVGGRMGGDVRVLSLTHAIRVMATVLIVPIWFRLEGLIGAASPGALVGLLDVSPRDYAVLGACAIFGALLGVKLRLPAATMLGPMALSAAVHLAGFSEAQPPYVLTAAAQVVLGCAIGQRFAGATLGGIARTVGHALAVTAIMLGLAIGFAAVLARASGEPFSALVLTYAPGGFAEMSLVALALGADTALVASHHLFRIAFVVSLAPWLFGRLGGRT